MSLNIRMDEGSTQISVTKGGVKHTKTVDFGELISLMQAHAVHDFGLLPPNTRYLATAGNNFTIAVEVPPGTRTVHVGGETNKVEGVQLPAALFVFQLVRRAGVYLPSQIYVYGLKGDRLLFSTDELFVYPLPNIHHEDNRICWGKNSTDLKLKSLAGVEGLIRTFFTAPFNSDLFDTKKLSHTFPWNKVSSPGDYNVKRYFEYLAENGFDRDWLRPLEVVDRDFMNIVKKVGR